MKNCKKLHKKHEKLQKIAIFLKIAKNRGRAFLEGQLQSFSSFCFLLFFKEETIFKGFEQTNIVHL